MSMIITTTPATLTANMMIPIKVMLMSMVAMMMKHNMKHQPSTCTLFLLYRCTAWHDFLIAPREVNICPHLGNGHIPSLIVG